MGHHLEFLLRCPLSRPSQWRKFLATFDLGTGHGVTGVYRAPLIHCQLDALALAPSRIYRAALPAHLFRPVTVPSQLAFPAKSPSIWCSTYSAGLSTSSSSIRCTGRAHVYSIFLIKSMRPARDHSNTSKLAGFSGVPSADQKAQVPAACWRLAPPVLRET